MSKDSHEDLVSLIFATMRLIREKTESHDRGKKFEQASFLQIKTLDYVQAHKSSHMNDIARYLRITPPSATSLINSLVKDGKLNRASDPLDRRVIRLNITTSGQTELKKALRQIALKMSGVLAKLTEHERAEFKHLLHKLLHS